MQRRQIAFPCALSVAAGPALLVPGTSTDITITMVLLGAGIVSTLWTGYGGGCLLCLGEAFAVGVGATSPALGALFQPVIAGEVCGDDRMSLVIGGSMITMASAGVLVFCNTLISLLAFIAVSAGIALGPMGFEARMNRRISAGGAT